MTTYSLHIRPEEVVRLIRTERAIEEGQPQFYVDAWEDYVIEEDYDRSAYGLHDGYKYDLASIEAELNIEPRIEQDYWILSVLVHKDLGPQIIEDENSLVGAELTLDEFEEWFLKPHDAATSVRLETQTPRAKAHFDQWWDDLKARHPLERGESCADLVKTSAMCGAGNRSWHTANKTNWSYRTREAVGVFSDPDALEAAIDELERSGFDRACISVLGTGKGTAKHLENLYDRVAEVADDGRAPRTAPTSIASRVEGEAASVAIPLYVGGFAGAAAVIASGGTLAAAVGASILGGTSGAGLGTILAHAVARRHARNVEEQLARGGMVLWVAVRNVDAEKRAISTLSKAGARNIHIHEFEREWGPHDRPISEAHVDPLLERDAMP